MCIPILPTDSITIVYVRLWRGFSAGQKITKFGGVSYIQGAHAVFRLGKPSFKKENVFALLRAMPMLFSKIFTDRVRDKHR